MSSTFFFFFSLAHSSIQSYRRGITIGSLCSRKLKGFRVGKERENEREKSTKSSSQYRQQ